MASNPAPTTEAQRAAHVRATVANHAIEALYPDAEDQANQRAYIEGVLNTDDLLKAAQDFVNRARRKNK